MTEEKYFLVETVSRFRIKYLVRADALTEDQAQHLVDEALVTEFDQTFLDEEVVTCLVCPDAILQKLNLPKDDIE